VTVETVDADADAKDAVQTEAYVYVGEATTQSWDYGAFRSHHLAGFLAMCDEWCLEYRGESKGKGIGEHIGRET